MRIILTDQESTKPGADPGNQFWNQDSTDILDQAEVGDVFGWGLGEPGTGNVRSPYPWLQLPWSRPNG